MPGKPRHKKGHRVPQGTRGRAAPVQPVAAISEAPEMVRAPAAPVRPRTVTAPAGRPAASPTVVPTPDYIGRELRAIIILGGVVTVVLIIVALLMR